MTEALASRDCVPCRGGTPPLGSQDIAPLRSHVPGWEVVQWRELKRSFRFTDFAAALAFVNSIGEVAEQQRHHPDLCLGWGRVEARLSTHKIQGLTESDFIFAAKIDRLAAEAPGLRAG